MVVAVAEEVSVVTPVSVVTVVVTDALESSLAEASILEAMSVAREDTDSATEERDAATEVAAPAQ